MGSLDGEPLGAHQKRSVYVPGSDKAIRPNAAKELFASIDASLVDQGMDTACVSPLGMVSVVCTV